MKPATNVPAPNVVKVSAPNAGSPGRPVNAAREPYKPSVRPAAQYAMQVGQPYTAGVQYEPAMNAAREPYKPSVRPTAQYAMQAGQPYAAGVRYEPAKPVKDAIQRFERK
jgi:hypothetical protein